MEALPVLGSSAGRDLFWSWDNLNNLIASCCYSLATEASCEWQATRSGRTQALTISLSCLMVGGTCRLSSVHDPKKGKTWSTLWRSLNRCNPFCDRVFRAVSRYCGVGITELSFCILHGSSGQHKCFLAPPTEKTHSYHLNLDVVYIDLPRELLERYAYGVIPQGQPRLQPPQTESPY